jgi:hypothetical protein
MPSSESAITFIIAAFVLALVLIMKKDSLPPRLKKTLAVFALIFVGSAFALIVYMLYNMGQTG